MQHIQVLHRLLQLLPRFGIGLGFGDRNVEQVCQMNHVSTELFLLICEIYSDSSFKPSYSELQQIDMGDLLSYLKAGRRDFAKLALTDHINYVNRRMFKDE